MSSIPASPFGKRGAAYPARPIEVGGPESTDHAAFFAAVRAELQGEAPVQRIVVPRSFTAALLAGLVVGCALAGFDVRGSVGAAEITTIAERVGVQVDTANLLPATILLGLLGGARIAAITMILVRSVLDRLGRTDHGAYAFGGALASACVASCLLAVGHHPPAHGWPIELLSGAGAGLFYRLFAGTRPA